VWSGATKRDLGKLQLAQNRTTRLALRTGQHGWPSEQDNTAGPQNRAARLALRTGQHGWPSEQGTTAGPQNRAARLALRTGQHGWPSEQGSTAGPQNRAARLALGCTQRANINDMHVHLSWLKVEDRLYHYFVRCIDMLKTQSCLFKRLAHSSDIYAQDMTPQVSLQSPSPEQTMGGAQYYMEP
jgi:hypothetical protein